MKTTLLLLGLAFAASLFAADTSRILLSGSSVSIGDGKASGGATAIVGDMTVTADVITFERQKNILRCEGAATIRIGDNVIAARDCAIELSAGEKKLFFLGQGSIHFSSQSDARYFPASPTDLIGRSADRKKMLQEFNARREREKTTDKAPAPAP